jgi:hypothetical protein
MILLVHVHKLSLMRKSWLTLPHTEERGYLPSAARCQARVMVVVSCYKFALGLISLCPITCDGDCLLVNAATSDKISQAKIAGCSSGPM